MEKKKPQIIRVGKIGIVNRTGKDMTREEFVRDIGNVLNMAVPMSEEWREEKKSYERLDRSAKKPK